MNKKEKELLHELIEKELEERAVKWERAKNFDETRIDLINRLQLCYVDSENEIIMYEGTFEAVFNFLAIFIEKSKV